MDENALSWVTRTKFSHTVCHRLAGSPSPENLIPTKSDHESSAQKPAADGMPSFAVPLDGSGRSSIPTDRLQQARKRLQRTQSTVTAVDLAELGLLDLERNGSVSSLNPNGQSLNHNLRDKAPIGTSISSGSPQSDFDSVPLVPNDKCLKPRQRDKTPPPVKLFARPSKESALSLKEQRMNFCRRDTSAPLARRATGQDFENRRSTHLTESKDRSFKPAKRDQCPLSSVLACSQTSTLTTNHGTKTLDPKRRDSSPLPLKNFSLRKFTIIQDPDRQNIKSKHRALSPIPFTILSDEFREARTETKRFSTPISRSRRKENDKGILKKLFSKESSNPSAFTSPMSAKMSMSRNHSQLRTSEKTNKARKDVSWAMYFDPAVCRVRAVDAMEECRINLSELYLGQRFAIGAHSRLYRGAYKTQDVAVKIINLPDESEYDVAMAQRLEKEFAGEVTLLSRLHHQNVIKLVGALKEDAVFCIVTEYLSGGSLRAFLHKLGDKTLPLSHITAIALGIAKGMEYVHSQDVIHRDLKPENILLDHDLCVKIADFGIACEEANCNVLVEDYGTYRFMAPEMIKHEPYGRKVDVYSFALVLWEMLTGRIPYEDMKPYQAAFAVFDKNLRPQIPSDCPSALRALIEQCWAVLPDDRPEFRQIVKDLEQLQVALERDGVLNLIPKHGHPRPPP